MSPQQQSVYLTLMTDVYRRLRDTENGHRFVREILGKGTPEAQRIACEQLFLVTSVHSFAPDTHQAFTECGGRYFEQPVDDDKLKAAISVLSDSERSAVAMQIAPLLLVLEQGPFGLFDEV